MSERYEIRQALDEACLRYTEEPQGFYIKDDGNNTVAALFPSLQPGYVYDTATPKPLYPLVAQLALKYGAKTAHLRHAANKPIVTKGGAL